MNSPGRELLSFMGTTTVLFTRESSAKPLSAKSALYNSARSITDPLSTRDLVLISEASLYLDILACYRSSDLSRLQVLLSRCLFRLQFFQWYVQIKRPEIH